MANSEPLSGKDSEALLKAIDHYSERPVITQRVLANTLLKYFHSQPFDDITDEGKVFEHYPEEDLMVLHWFVFTELLNPFSEVRRMTSEAMSQILRLYETPISDEPISEGYETLQRRGELPELPSPELLWTNWAFDWDCLYEVCWEDSALEQGIEKIPPQFLTKLQLQPKDYFEGIGSRYFKWLTDLAKVELLVGEVSVFDSLLRRFQEDDYQEGQTE